MCNGTVKEGKSDSLTSRNMQLKIYNYWSILSNIEVWLYIAKNILVFNDLSQLEDENPPKKKKQNDTKKGFLGSIRQHGHDKIR